MKINKFVEDLKAKSAAELNEELVAAKKELFNRRFQNATNQLDNTSRIKEDFLCGFLSEIAAREANGGAHGSQPVIDTVTSGSCWGLGQSPKVVSIVFTCTLEPASRTPL